MKLSHHKDEMDNPEKDDILRFVRFLQILRIHKWLALSVFLVVFAIIMAYALKQPTLYKAQYDVFYNETIQEYMKDSEVPVIKSDFDKNFWMSNMLSYEIAKKTSAYAGLSYSPEEIRSMIAVEMMDKKKEDRVPLYKVTVTSSNASDIPVIIRSYIHALNEMLIKHQMGNSEKLLGYLAAQLRDNNAKLNEIDLTILNGSPAKSGEIYDVDKVKSDLESFRIALLNAQINLATLQASKTRTEHELKNLDGTIVNESAFSEPLKVQLMNLEVDLARALTKYKEDHPAVKAIRKNIEQINQMLRDNVEQKMEIKSLMQNPLKTQLMSKLMDLQIATVSEETHVVSLQKVIAELERKTLPNAKDETQQQLLRNRDLVFITIKQLNSKMIEAGSAASGSLSRFIIVDEPSSPILPANRRLWTFLLIAFCAGIAAAVCVVFIYDLLDNRIMVVSDYTQFYTLPVWGTLTHEKHKKDRSDDPDYPISYRRWSELGGILINIRHAVQSKKASSFAICSSIRREGKTGISLQLASALADKRMKVLLVDLDFFDPKLTAKLKQLKKPGLSDFISADAGLESILYKTEFEGLTFVPAGSIKGRPDHYYDDKLLTNFIEQVRDQYDIILFDTPAALYISDIFNFLNLIDGVMVVVRLRYSTRNALDKMFHLIRGHQTQLMGTIINGLEKPAMSKKSQKEGYPYYHYGYENPKKEIAGSVHSNQERNPRGKRIFFYILALVVLLGGAFTGYTLYKREPAAQALFASPSSASPESAAPSAPAITAPTTGAPAEGTSTAVAKGIPTAPAAKSPGDVKAQPQPNANKKQTNAGGFLDTVKMEGGKRLTLLAEQYYGNKLFWVYIYKANQAAIPDPNKIPSGILVHIPNLELQGINTKDPDSIQKAKALQAQILSGKAADNAIVQ